MRIAVCDDDRRICAVLKNEITSLVPDAKVDIYSNGMVLLKHDMDMDILFLDIEMPEMDGHRLTRLIKEDDRTKNIPVVIFSSLVNDEMKKKGEQLGADAQLSKPEIGNHFKPTAKIRMSSAPSQKLGIDVSIRVKFTEKRS